MAGEAGHHAEGQPAGSGLRAVDIGRSYDGVVALGSVTLDLHRHEVVGLIGPNGAGKSTLVNIVSGFDAPDHGHVEMEGTDITGWPPHIRGRSGLARTFQHGHSFPMLTVQENVEVSALGCGANAEEARSRAARVLDMLDLATSAQLPAAVLPHGQERKLGVARALATEPKFLLLDEPAAGLSEAEIPEFGDVIRTVRSDHGVGVLLIDHNVSLIMAVCDRIQVLDQGRTIAQGTPEEITQNADVATAYLGTIGA